MSSAGQPDLPCLPKHGYSGPSTNNLLCFFQGKYEERFLKEETISQQINSVESLPEMHLSPEDEKSEQLLQRKLRVRSRPPSKPTIVRGVTYYKAQSTESENDIEEQRELDDWYLTPVQPLSPAWGTTTVLLFHGKSPVAKEIGHCFGSKYPTPTPFQK